MNAGEGIERIGLGGLALQAADLQKALAHEREMGQFRPWTQHHRVGAHRNCLGDRQGGLGQLTAGLLKGTAEFAGATGAAVHQIHHCLKFKDHRSPQIR
jgi:hypothetical protein